MWSVNRLSVKPMAALDQHGLLPPKHNPASVPPADKPDGNVDDCDVASPVNPAQPYQGKCKSGWVNSHWIKLLAG